MVIFVIIWPKWDLNIKNIRVSTRSWSNHILGKSKGNKTVDELDTLAAFSGKIWSKFVCGFVRPLTFFFSSRIFPPDWPGSSAKSWQQWQVHKTAPFAAVPTSYHSSRWFIHERIVIYMVKLSLVSPPPPPPGSLWATHGVARCPAKKTSSTFLPQQGTK
jgi:hypothetical protein